MPTHFFQRLFVACFAMVIAFFCFGVLTSKRARREFSQTVYFAVYSTKSVQAAAGEIALRGGAGYALSEEDVAFGVYFSQESALESVESLRGKYPTAQVKTCEIALGDERLLNTFYGALQVLDGWRNALENGARQSVVKNGLAEVAGVFRRMGAESGKTIFYAFADQTLTASEGIVYAGELRYLLCSMIDELHVSLEKR